MNPALAALIASLSTYVVSAVGAAALLMGHELDQKHLEAIGTLVISTSSICVIAYLIFHFLHVKDTKQLADKLQANNIPVPPPADRETK